ncbi:zinc finger protein 239-like [Chrysoperla carnea]|uniref:zinc finger protein 239-like n=1 Tax=Chrysoperla carnea TaxID=189513 RepID=UPI001D0703E5|nr:zinc finger protein 239-like [Chrysoperla carnea]
MEKKFACSFENCKASFPKKSKLVVHERVHTNERPFVCDNCGKAYISNSHLKRHINTTHSEVRPTYKCSICMLNLRSLTNLRKHQARLHVNGRKYQYECDECQQGFYKKSQLNAHIFSHTQKAPYTCSHCSEGFLNRASLKKHEKKSHTEYPCSVCDEKFNRWTDLLLHKKVNHKKVTTKEFKCEKCVKAFSKQEHLTAHEETHKDIRTFFTCPEENCEREYLYKRNLVQHIKIAHEKKVYKCEFPNCEKILQHKKTFIHHMNLHNKPLNSTEKIKTKQRAKRKDAGVPKYSAIMQLSGLVGTVSKPVEEEILNDSNITINKLIEIIST